MNNNKNIIELLNLKSINFTYFENNRFDSHMNNWIKSFCKTDNYKCLEFSKKEIEYNTFTVNLHPHFSGIEAINKYNEIPTKNYTIYIGDIKTSFICEGSIKIIYEELLEYFLNNNYIFDLYITHSNYKWTFVAPHEKDLGPYFSLN